jgi:amino acid adenylation domain-containing protein
MPVHMPLPTIDAGEGDRCRSSTSTLPDALEAALRHLGQEMDATFFEVMAAGWAAFLHRYTDEDSVAFAYPVSVAPEETAARVSGTMGCHVNTLPMALEVAGLSLSELVAGAHRAGVAARPHRDVPWERIVEAMREDGHLEGGQPFLNVGLAPTHLREVPLVLADLEVVPEPPPAVRAIWALTLEYQVGSPTRLRLSGREDRFPEWLVEALLQTLVALLRQAVEAPDRSVGDLPLVDAPHRTRLLAHGQGSTPGPQVTGTLGARFMEIAAAHPDAVAVQTGEEGLTYWALDIRSNRLARALLAALPSPPVVGQRVALLFDRSAEAVVAMVALAKLGLTYVPLRPTDPPARWRTQLDAADAVGIIGFGRLTARLPETLSIPSLAVDAPGVLSGQSDDPIECAVTPEAAAYLLFTSGSTGRPKGVLVSHRAVLRLACGGGAHALGTEDVVVHGASLAFDISTWEVWGALLEGATILMVSRADMLDTAALRGVLDAHQATAMVLPSSLFHVHVDVQPDLFARLRLLIVGGDVVGPDQVAAVLAQSRGTPTTVLNAYGSTENTVFSTVARISQARSCEALPIGRPITGSTCFVVDAARSVAGASPTLVPTGFPGELWVGGLGVMLGYVGDPEATAAHLVTPSGLGPDAGVLYRTGDRVRWRADGQLDFLGRLDDQVKIGGQRLSPGEVVTHALRHPEICQAAVVATPGPEPELVLAYTLAVRSRLDATGVQRHLAATLPGWAVPRRSVRLEALPMTPNGKLDKDAVLALAPPSAPPAAVHTPPSSHTERALVALWTRHLTRRQIGVHDRFVDLGGDSLRAVRLAAAMGDTLGREVSVADIYRFETIAGLADHLCDGGGEASGEQVSHAPAPEPASRPAIVPLGLAQLGHWHALRQGMPDGYPGLLHIQARIDPDALQEAWDDVLNHHEIPWMHLDFDEPRMRRVDARACKVMRMDLTRLEPEAARYQAMSRIRRDAQEPFQNRTPMTRVFLAQAAHDSWFFGISAPQALVDAHTLRLLATQLHDAYLSRLDGHVYAPQQPMSLDAYVQWERERVTTRSVETGVAFYEGQLDGDASWTVPTTHLRDTTHGEVATLDAHDVGALQDLARDQGVSLEATLTYCLFLTLHGVHGAPLVRCTSAHPNREEPELDGLPLMMAGAMIHQSRLARSQSPRDAVGAFGARHVAAVPHARLPSSVLSRMNRLLLLRGRLSPSLAARLVGAIWARLSDTPRVVLTHQVDLALCALVGVFGRRLGRWFGRTRTRTEGCLVSISGPLGAHTPLGSPRLPIARVRTPVDTPETTPGDPRLDLFRDQEGVKALFQARYAPAAVRALLEAYQVVVHQVASRPDTPQGDLMDALTPHAQAFERAADD